MSTSKRDPLVTAWEADVISRAQFLATEIVIRFGKYEGRKCADIPLRWIEETLLDMRPSAQTRIIRWLLDSPEIVEAILCVDTELAGQKSLREVFDAFLPDDP